MKPVSKTNNCVIKNSMLSICESWKNIKGCLLKVPSDCCICLSALMKPAKLACGHRFCENCLGEYWHIQCQQDHIICPLCRACVTNISFIEEEEAQSTNTFRKTFDPTAASDAPSSFGYKSVLCMKIGLVFPILYYAVQYLRVPYQSLIGNSLIRDL